MLTYARSSYVNNGYRIGPVKPPVPPEPEFELADLFAGEAGFLWPDLPYHQDPAGTAETGVGDVIGLISDESGNGVQFTQATVTARPVLDVQDGTYVVVFDQTDDILSADLPAIESGTLVLAGTKGIWIDDDFNHTGGAFTVGPTTYTGGPAGILEVVGDLIVGGSFAIDRQLTAEERTRAINKLKSMGAPGVFELGPELVVNGDFSDGSEGWVVGADWAITSGRAKAIRVAGSSALARTLRQDTNLITVGDRVFITIRCSEAATLPSGELRVFLDSSESDNSLIHAVYPVGLTVGTYSAAFTVVDPVSYMRLFAAGIQGSYFFDGAINNVSLRKLELVP